MSTIGGQNLAITFERHTIAPLYEFNLGLQTQPFTQFAPQMTELPKAGLQHPVARRQRVGHGRFPATGPGGGKNKHLALVRAKDRFEILKKWQHGGGVIGAPMVFQR